MESFPSWSADGPNLVVEGDNLQCLKELPDGAFQLVYLDPPFNTGKTQKRQTLRTTRSKHGSRVGFKGEAYDTKKGPTTQYVDSFDDYWAFLAPRLVEARRLLADSGTLFLHLDYREVHYARVFLDNLFGPANFVNEIVWAYDYGARTTKRWPSKHDSILVYAKVPGRRTFNGGAGGAVNAEPYRSPGLTTEEDRKRGALPSDVWWHTIVSPTGKEKTGYATQKPLGVLRRIIQASSKPGDWVLDFFAGSGTTGVAAAELGRKFVLVDQNPQALDVMTKRFEDAPKTELKIYRAKAR